MPDQKITELTDLPSPALVDLLAVVDDVAGVPTTKKLTLQNLFNLFSDHSGLTNLAWSVAGHTIDTAINMNDNPLTNVEYIDFNLTAAASHSEGRISWNDDDKTLDIHTDVTNTKIQVGQEIVLRATNVTGVTITNGSIVYISGAQGSRPTIALADADSGVTSDATIGIVTTDIAHNGTGYVTTFGLVRNVDTSTFTAGDRLYLSQTAGEFTNTSPITPAHAVSIGYVLFSNATTGIIFTQINVGDHLGSLHDVLETSPTNGDILVYDLANSYWENSPNHGAQFHYWDGSFLESHQLSVTSDGATIKATLEKNGTGDLTMRFSDGYAVLDCTPIVELTISAGTATAPVMHYIYIPQSTKVLTSSTSGFPATGTEHIRVGTITVRSASLVQTEGALVSRWNDHSGETTDARGHALHLGERLRQFFGEWSSGTESTVSITTNVGVPDDVELAVTAGVVYQLHPQSVSAFDMSLGDTAYVINHPTTPYTTTSDLADQLTDANNVSMSGKYYTVIVWGINSSGNESDFVMINLPNGSYSNLTNALSDVDGHTVYDIPQSFKNTGFLIGQYTFKHSTTSGGTWTQENYIDLRGKLPNTSAGSVTGSSGITTLLGLTDTPSSYVGEAGKKLVVNVGETALELIDALTATEVVDLTDAGDSTLHYHATDRARANHTGTQTASTISDFDTEVGNHTDVSANTTHRGLITGNPHSVTATEVGLGNVTNVATDDTAYNATSWNTNLDAPTKNAVRDKIETMDTAIGLNTAKETNATHTGDVTGDTALTIALDAVKDTHIDWGTGAGQVSAVDMPIADSGVIITATEVEGALQENRTAIDLNTTHAGASSGVHGATGNVVGDTDSQTLTNKTMDGDLNTFSDINITSLKQDGTNANKFLNRDGSGNVVSNAKTIPGGDVLGTTDSQTLTNKDLTNSNNSFPDASLTAKGDVELATAAETTTGTDATRAVTPDGLAGSDYGKRIVVIPLLDNTTDNAVGDGAGGITFTIPEELNGFNLVNAHASVETAGTTGTQSMQIHNVTQVADMLTTKITIDTTELTSYTAATAPVIDTANDDVATGDKLRFDTDVIQTTAAKGLSYILTFQLP